MNIKKEPIPRGGLTLKTVGILSIISAALRNLVRSGGDSVNYEMIDVSEFDCNCKGEENGDKNSK